MEDLGGQSGVGGGVKTVWGETRVEMGMPSSCKGLEQKDCIEICKGRVYFTPVSSGRGIEPRPLHMLGKCSLSYSPAIFAFVSYRVSVLCIYVFRMAHVCVDAHV